MSDFRSEMCSRAPQGRCRPLPPLLSLRPSRLFLPLRLHLGGPLPHPPPSMELPLYLPSQMRHHSRQAAYLSVLRRCILHRRPCFFLGRACAHRGQVRGLWRYPATSAADRAPTRHSGHCCHPRTEPSHGYPRRGHRAAAMPQELGERTHWAGGWDGGGRGQSGAIKAATREGGEVRACCWRRHSCARRRSGGEHCLLLSRYRL